MSKGAQTEDAVQSARPPCFAIMPIADPDGYVKGHFKHVFEDIMAPACDKAGFKALRADQVKQSNLIHLDILQTLLNAPMAVCDLSSRNPNVLFELALRQAFDKPVALVQEVGTPVIFDISPLRYTEYRKERTYHEVLEDQNSIAAAIRDTFEGHKAGKGVNSIVKLLSLSKPASLPEINAPEASADIQQLILAEVSQLREEFRRTRREPVPARKVWREQASSEFGLTRELLRQAEIEIATGTSAEDLERASRLVIECRMQWTRLMERMPHLSDQEREMVQEYDRRIDMLEHDFSRAMEAAMRKGKK